MYVNTYTLYSITTEKHVLSIKHNYSH